MRYILAKQDYLFGVLANSTVQPSVVAYSDTDNGTSWPVGNRLNFGQDDGDQITGFRMAGATANTISDNLDFAAVGITAYNATAATGYTAAQLTVAVSNAGLVILAGTSAAALSLADTISAIQSVVTANNGDTALFTYATAGVTSTYVFNNATTTDSVVQLVGISGNALTTTASSVTAQQILIS
jgi:hypothetical protein